MQTPLFSKPGIWRWHLSPLGRRFTSAVPKGRQLPVDWLGWPSDGQMPRESKLAGQIASFKYNFCQRSLWWLKSNQCPLSVLRSIVFFLLNSSDQGCSSPKTLRQRNNCTLYRSLCGITSTVTAKRLIKVYPFARWKEGFSIAIQNSSFQILFWSFHCGSTILNAFASWCFNT